MICIGPFVQRHCSFVQLEHAYSVTAHVVLQVVHEGGVYANGQVVVQPLPAAIYGDSAERTVPLRRLEAVLTEEEVLEHRNKEMQKV